MSIGWGCGLVLAVFVFANLAVELRFLFVVIPKPVVVCQFPFAARSKLVVVCPFAFVLLHVHCTRTFVHV